MRTEVDELPVNLQLGVGYMVKTHSVFAKMRLYTTADRTT